MQNHTNQQPTNLDGHTRYDDRATEIVERHIENDEGLSEVVREMITRAYEDAELATAADSNAITAPRADAADAIAAYINDDLDSMDELHGLRESLVNFALDRCDFGAIVDHQRQREAENVAAFREAYGLDLLEQIEKSGQDPTLILDLYDESDEEGED